ncbi:hypothetical protein EGJ27_05825 [Pseudomonas sp. v388]|uniref:hypothetical protein n=1 Tax=Pseudomonas sp. v388 TaxID=2479849 RepID=UPI000F7B9F92|nr:hypothetical protein [Pseudomonas sp. v388]RRV09290.1 hypothetical protein EGJ27_05825 [Pseudomonas sp. v388]
MHHPRNASNGLSADEEDAPRRRRRTYGHKSDRLRNTLVCLFLICAVGYGIFYLTKPAAPVTALPPFASAPETPVQTPAPRSASSVPSARRPQALADCIGPDNLINAAVATCRFGKYPDPVHDPQAQGMVSAQYMQQYKTEREPTRQRHNVQQTVTHATVWQWDRKRSYRAEWLITDNHIDGSSVCRNWRAGSIEYRECRKGAKVYFREQCRSPNSSAAARQRYCSAEGSFSPM